MLPSPEHGMKRRGLLRFGTLLSAFGASSVAALGASTAQAASSDKTPPNTTYVPTAEKGAALGVATLDKGAKIPATQIPDLSTSYVAWVNAAKYGAIGDDITDARAAIDAAILACSNAGGGVVFLPAGKYVVSGPLTPRSGVTVFGPGATIRASVNGNVFYARDVACKDFALDGLTFTGTVNSFPTAPTRTRTTSGPGTVSAFQASGDTDTDNPGGARIENLTIRNCIIRNCSGLPLLLKGVRGILRVQDNEFTYNMDVGFVCYEELIFTGNHIYGSADNGVSASRGGRKITVSHNTIENCAYNGIFLAGWKGDKGPQNFSVSVNTIKDVGHAGVYMDAAPKNGSITGNSLDGGYYRGPVDDPTDSAVSGVFLGGYPTDNRAMPSDYAQDIAVTGNQIMRFPRAGVFLTGAKRILVSGNLLTGIGTQFMADGVTAISGADVTQNVGILLDNASTSSEVIISVNQIVDGRPSPYTNWAVVPNATGSATSLSNTMAGCRNPYNLTETGPTRNFNFTPVFLQNTKHTQGATAGSSAATGTVPGFDINGAAGSTRRFRLLTGATDRWQFGASGDPEKGANTGTNFRINAHSDDGVFFKTMLDITRDGKIGFVGAVPVAPPSLPAAANDWASTLALANALREALIAMGLAK